MVMITDLEDKKVRDLHLYIRPLEGEIIEVLVLDNELPIYHTTMDDVALKKAQSLKRAKSRNKRSITDIRRATTFFVAEGGGSGRKAESPDRGTLRHDLYQRSWMITGSPVEGLSPGKVDL